MEKLTIKDLEEVIKKLQVPKKIENRKPTKEEKWFGKHIWPKMNDVEKTELWMLSLNGIIQDNVVLMGSVAINRYLDYKKKMIEKYDTTTS